MDEPSHLESTADLLECVRRGERAAVGRLVARYKPILVRFAHGRLPRAVHGLVDTEEIVLSTLERALHHVESFESKREGAFLAYLRRAVMNRIRDEIRRSARRPEQVDLTEDHPALGPSPLEELMGKEAMERYEAALQSLTEAQREAVILRLELRLTFPQIADAIGSDSPNAVRMSISRALARMARIMKEPGSR